MNKLLSLALALTLATAGSAALAGIAPAHDNSQLNQSGAKIAAPKKQEEDQNKRNEPEQGASEKR
jgi:hypothetical protein